MLLPWAAEDGQMTASPFFAFFGVTLNGKVDSGLLYCAAQARQCQIMVTWIEFHRARIGIALQRLAENLSML